MCVLKAAASVMDYKIIDYDVQFSPLVCYFSSSISPLLFSFYFILFPFT